MLKSQENRKVHIIAWGIWNAYYTRIIQINFFLHIKITTNLKTHTTNPPYPPTRKIQCPHCTKKKWEKQREERWYRRGAESAQRKKVPEQTKTTTSEQITKRKIRKTENKIPNGTNTEKKSV